MDFLKTCGKKHHRYKWKFPNIANNMTKPYTYKYLYIYIYIYIYIYKAQRGLGAHFRYVRRRAAMNS